MQTSLFDLFKIGIGPSSSHTVGPMHAANRFGRILLEKEVLGEVNRVRVELYGSLALTGVGHGTDRGVLLGLMGLKPAEVDPSQINRIIESIHKNRELLLFGRQRVVFQPNDLVFHCDESLPGHSNGMRFTAFHRNDEVLESRVYFSVGGGFVKEESLTEQDTAPKAHVPHPFSSAAELLKVGEELGWSIHRIMLVNETAWKNIKDVVSGIHEIWNAMQLCTQRGMQTQGYLPGGLNVRRRAFDLAQNLKGRSATDLLNGMDWINTWAIAVNEENAAGGRVVTAPTNGAAGVIPSVAHYYMHFLNGDSPGIERYFLGAAAIGVLYKENASISGAEVGCQGEVGVACSMAAGGLVSALKGSNQQVEHAAEIAMEHNLGMTCDPVGGLVQIPCIERNAFGAVKAVNASRLAMDETTGHKVSLDQVIRAMYETGRDMQTRYKETALGGLALNVIEC